MSYRRELRAAAALARFDQQKTQEKAEQDDTGSEGSDDDGDEEDYEKIEGVDAVDLDGKKLLDGKGRVMVKVCEDENPEDQDARNELLELRNFGSAKFNEPGIQARSWTADPGSVAVPDRGSKKTLGVETETQRSKKQSPDRLYRHMPPAKRPTSKMEYSTQIGTNPPLPKGSPGSGSASSTIGGVCSICSFANDAMAPTCAMCANVLHIKIMTSAWACNSQTCRGTNYRNAADCGICGLCGARKPVPSVSPVYSDR